MKTCRVCGEAKPLAEFYAHPMMADGHLNECKVCKRSYQRTRNDLVKDDPDYKAARAKWARKGKLRHAYGLTVDEYKAMLAEQGGCCAICGTTDPGLDLSRLQCRARAFRRRP